MHYFNVSCRQGLIVFDVLSSLIPKYLVMLQLLSNDAHDASTYVLRGRTGCPRSPYLAPMYIFTCLLLENKLLGLISLCINVLLFLGSQDSSDIMSPSKRSSQKYVIDGLTEKSSQITDPWDRLFKILSVVGMRCEWQMDKGRR